MRKTRFCSPHLSWVWNPTTEKWLAARLSCRSCTTAKGRRPVRGSTRPTGFMGPNSSVSRPRLAMTSTGRHPSKKNSCSKACSSAHSAVVRASKKAWYSASSSGQLT